MKRIILFLSLFQVLCLIGSGDCSDMRQDPDVLAFLDTDISQAEKDRVLMILEATVAIQPNLSMLVGESKTTGVIIGKLCRRENEYAVVGKQNWFPLVVKSNSIHSKVFVVEQEVRQDMSPKEREKHLAGFGPEQREIIEKYSSGKGKNEQV